MCSGPHNMEANKEEKKKKFPTHCTLLGEQFSLYLILKSDIEMYSLYNFTLHCVHVGAGDMAFFF